MPILAWNWHPCGCWGCVWGRGCGGCGRRRDLRYSMISQCDFDVGWLVILYICWWWMVDGFCSFPNSLCSESAPLSNWQYRRFLVVAEPMHFLSSQFPISGFFVLDIAGPGALLASRCRGNDCWGGGWVTNDQFYLWSCDSCGAVYEPRWLGCQATESVQISSNRPVLRSKAHAKTPGFVSPFPAICSGWCLTHKSPIETRMKAGVK